MKKSNMKYWLTGICLLLLIATAALKYNQVNAAGDFVFATNNGTYGNGETILLNSDTQDIWIADNAGVGIPVSTNILWDLQGADVLELNEKTTGTPPTAQPLMRTMKRLAPGYATITATFTYDNITYVKQCNVQIDFEVSNNDLQNTTTVEKSLYFGKDDNTTKPIKLRYTNANSAGEVDNTSPSLSWTTEDPNVATVDQTGNVTKVGAGKTRIKISTNTTSKLANPLVQYVTVVVSSAGRPTTSTGADQYSLTMESSSEVTIITNAVDASKLTWRFYDSNQNLIADTAKYLSYSLPGDNTITISNLKAGQYYIAGFIDTDHIPSPLNLNANETAATPYLRITLTVPPVISQDTVYMSVGDTYSIWNKSNLLEDTPISWNLPVDSNAVSIVNGIITAEHLGSVPVTVTVNGETFTFTVIVIDYIKLNMSQANVYTSGTVSLIAYTSNNTAIKWESGDTRIATITGNGNTAVVKALTVGQTTITASQVINGVVKRATCIIFVQAGVSKITINPAEVSLNIGDSTTLQAQIEPSGMSNVNLTWSSSDESVVSVEATDSTRAVTIKGKAAGTAIITAINKDNVVVGYSRVTIKEKVSSITLSASNLSLLLSSRTYQLRAIISPDTATNQNVTWRSTNTAVATVNTSGLVTLVSAGTTSIIATSQDDPTIVAICNITVGQSVTDIKLDETTKTMYVGDTARMSYIIAPTNASNRDVTWSTTNSAVITVDTNGQVTARGSGVAVLVLRSSDGSYMSTCTITVKQKATGIDFDVTNLELNVGQTYTIKVTATPADATEFTLTWTSLDNAIATVDDKGTITGRAVGKTVVMANVSTGGVVYCNVEVKAVATGLQLNYSEKDVVIGDYLDIRATIIPSNAASTVNVVWTSSKPSVATINSSGRLRAIKGGTTVITAKTSDGRYTSFCIINVVEKVTTLKLNKTYYRLGLNKSYTLIPTVKTNAASNPTIRWTSSNTRIATVDQKGKVTGRAIGTVTITAAARDGSGVSAISTIRVVRAVSSISLNRTSVNTIVGRNFTLKATVKPTNATFKTVNWTSSDEKVAIVDSSGRVTALSAGSATIRASAKDNSGRYATSYVVVGPRVPANSVTIINQNLTMVVGESTTVQKAINPTTSTESFIWQSDNKTVAAVDSSTGRVTARTPGIASITVMTESGKMATTKVTVVGLNTTNLTLEQYTNYRLSVVGVTSGVTWDVADNSIALVTNGFVSTRKAGTTTITAIVNGRRLTCRLTVTKIR